MNMMGQNDSHCCMHPACTVCENDGPAFFPPHVDAEGQRCVRWFDDDSVYTVFCGGSPVDMGSIDDELDALFGQLRAPPTRRVFLDVAMGGSSADSSSDRSGPPSDVDELEALPEILLSPDTSNLDSEVTPTMSSATSNLDDSVTCTAVSDEPPTRRRRFDVDCI